MHLQTLRTLRLSIGVTTAVALAYGSNWPLPFLAPLLTVLFLALPAWITWRAALKILMMLGAALLIGIFISEYLLHYPLLCVPLYVLMFFWIYYNDSASASSLDTLFLTLGITMIPISSFTDTSLSHFVAGILMVDMCTALFFAWLFHTVMPDTLARETPVEASQSTSQQKPNISEGERVRLALVSTIVASCAVIIFFSLNLAQYALAMILICVMAATPNKNASFSFFKGNSFATLIGGAAAIVSYNLLSIAPTYLFLIFLTLLISLIFSSMIYSPSPSAPIFQSAFTTFLVLLGTSTGGGDSASSDFYIRIAQIVFAGLFTILAMLVVGQLLRPRLKSADTINCT